MATVQARPLRWARSPFYFNSAAHIIRIGRDRATTLGEFGEILKRCADEAIFQHTFQTLEEHHYVQEGFTNDFAQWSFSACNEVGLAERLASVDVREFTSIKALREKINATVDDYLKKNPQARDRVAFEPFYFCASDTVVVPTPFVARNLGEFADGLQRVSLHSIHFHFIEARVRLKLNSNDFSLWLEEEMDLGSLADRLNRIDIYTSTLQDVRRKILKIVESAV
ncbi:MAG: hypothetical protein DMG66_01740 [Acidobacteria bacterium]|nr:MAG: hypothetical protein DMG66_01740 [Acidobacteriota bacterium]